MEDEKEYTEEQYFRGMSVSFIAGMYITLVIAVIIMYVVFY